MSVTATAPETTPVEKVTDSSPASAVSAEILIVNRDPEVRIALQKAVLVGGLSSTMFEDWEEAVRCLGRNHYSAIVVGIDSSDSVTRVKNLRENCPHVRIAAVAQAATPELVRDVMREGADEFIFGPLSSKKIVRRLTDLLSENQAKEDPREALGITEGPVGAIRVSLDATRGAGTPIIAKSDKMRRLLKIAERIAPTDSTVLVQGESGTGKELIARWIHEHSPRAESPFVEVNCGALPENLLESQLFGHEKGSFTGAVHRQLGLFEVADKGTIFLDEIGEMSLAMQVKLLRVLQSREFRRIGGSQVVRVDVRVIAASNRELKEEVDEGRFRSDLFYRLNVISLDLPPLRERRDEVPDLVENFCERLAQEKGLPERSFSKEAVEALQKLRWPGNVRELENAVERLILLSGGETVVLADLDEHLEARADVPLGSSFAPTLTLDEVKRLHIANVLRHNNGNKMKTARTLKINVKTLYNLIRSLQIDW